MSIVRDGLVPKRIQLERELVVSNIQIVAGMVLLFLTGCTSQKVLQATGGSRADGIVNLSYEVGMFENPVVDMSQADKIARKRCEAWGYTQAEAFGGHTTQCQAYNAYGNCLRAFVTVPYQCTGADATPAPPTPTVGSTYAPSANAGTTNAPQFLQPSASAYAPQPAASTYDPPQPTGIVTQQGNSAPASSPIQGVTRNKPPPIIVFTHASDATRADQSADFDDMINAVANGAKPPSPGN